MTINTFIILFAIVIIVFNIWNTFNLSALLKRPLKVDALNDQKYWELKYKMQYMITVFSIILFIVGYLGYNSLQGVKESVRKEFQGSMDSLTSRIDSFKLKLSDYSSIADNQFERIDSIRKTLIRLGLKQSEVSRFLSGTFQSATDLSARVDELINNDQLRQNMFVVDEVAYKMNLATSGEALYTTYYFKDLKTVNGNSLPKFTKRPYIIGLSNESIDLKVANITTESFDLMVYSYPGDRDITKDFFITLVLIERK